VAKVVEAVKMASASSALVAKDEEIERVVVREQFGVMTVFLT
jgi:hypothetical protein